MDKKKVALILSGCGVYDGSEIHETTLTLLALDQQNVDVVCLSLNKPQLHVVNHANQAFTQNEERNCLIESARLARGPVMTVDQFNVADVDALVFPGGFGVAKNLCSFANDAANHTVDPDIEALLKAAHAQQKPMAFMCIAPVIAAKVFPGVKLTVGSDAATIQAIETMGAVHQDAGVDDVVVDEKYLIVSSPAYMVAQSIKELSTGITRLVEHVLALTQQEVNV